MKDEIVCKKMIKKVVREEMENVKQEILEDIRKMIQGGIWSIRERYLSKKENVIIIKPKVEQKSETTKRLIKEKVDIKNMAMRITKLRKGSKGTVILGCETGEEMEKLKTAVQAKLGENFKVTESLQMKPKIKIVNIDEEDIKLNDNELIDTIKKQNKVAVNKEFQIRIIKKIIKEKRNYNVLNARVIIILQKIVQEMRHATNVQEIIKQLKISDEHDALDPKCPTYKRVIQEEKKRAGWEDNK
ncbi:uncharacterized protein [Anoplolepis gracilipes]|uniref:uncharacterized protein n=1 Tax=Anoplolepis gracilipes TaxID=354296 RepID=UPI003B9E1864